MPQSETTKPVRRSRQQTQAETRARVLAAAADAFTERGYHAVSVAQIAAAAGYTVGAVYSNFVSKDELFLAILDVRIGEHVAALAEAYASGATPHEGLAAVSDLFEGRLGEQFEWNLAVMEFTLNSRRDPELCAALAQRHHAARTAFADAIEFAAADVADRELAAPPDVIASALLGVGSGLLFEHLLEPHTRSATAAAYRHTLFSTIGLDDEGSGSGRPE